MAKILTGVQSTGTPHLGNLLGAIIPSIQMANKSNEESYFFIANLHSLTQIKDPEVLQKNQFAEIHQRSGNMIFRPRHILIAYFNSIIHGW